MRSSSVLSTVLPITKWAKNYNLSIGVSDVIAGITVALTMIPQSIGYATLAGLEPQYGLYSSLTGGFVYMLMGSSPEISIGPSALVSLLTLTYTSNTSPDMAILLCFIGGIIQMLAGVLRLGFLVSFFSIPVVSGFTSAAALTIATSQVKGLLGLTFSADTFTSIWTEVFQRLHEIKLEDTLLSVGCCTALMLMQKMDCLNVKQDTKVEKMKLKHRMLEKTTWFLSVSRNATVVIACTMLAYIVKKEDGSNMLLLTGEVASGLPTFKLPNFSTKFNGESYNFIEMISYLNSGLIVVPLVAIIANISIAKAFCKEARLNATTEIIALGACNFVGAFASAFPSNGAFSRSALCHASGAKTPATGLVTGLLVLFTLWFLTPFFYYIPKAALASVIVCAVLHMVNLRIFKDIWNNNNKLDLVPLTGTILACLALDVVYGIMVGVAIDIAILLYFNASPKFDVDCAVSTEGFGYIKVTSGGGLFFPSYGTILDLMDKVDLHGEKHQLDRLLPIVIDCKNLHRVDWTTVQGLKMFVKDIKRTGKDIIIMGLKSNLSAKLASQLGKTIQFCQGKTALEEALRDCRLTVKISE